MKKKLLFLLTVCLWAGFFNLNATYRFDERLMERQVAGACFRGDHNRLADLLFYATDKEVEEILQSRAVKNCFTSFFKEGERLANAGSSDVECIVALVSSSGGLNCFSLLLSCARKRELLHFFYGAYNRYLESLDDYTAQLVIWTVQMRMEWKAWFKQLARVCREGYDVQALNNLLHDKWADAQRIREALAACDTSHQNLFHKLVIKMQSHKQKGNPSPAAEMLNILWTAGLDCCPEQAERAAFERQDSQYGMTPMQMYQGVNG